MSDMADIGGLAFAGVMLMVLFATWTTAKGVGALGVLVVCVALIAFIVPRSLFGHGLMVYGLSDQRLIVVNYLLFGAVRSFAGRDIDRLMVNEFDGRGDIVFRREERDRWTPQSPGDPGNTLVGIDDPLRVAGLIQNTLAPSTPIERVGRSRP